MAAVKTLIERIELASSAASITFSDIPQTFTHLELVVSARGTDSSVREIFIRPNGSTTSATARILYGTGSGVGSYSDTKVTATGFANGSGTTANTFNSSAVYIPNYTSSNYKSFSADSVTENNATASYQDIGASLWSSTDAITSLALVFSIGNFAQYSSASLYGWTRGSDGVTTVS